jgi:hypothetical protein
MSRLASKLKTLGQVDARGFEIGDQRDGGSEEIVVEIGNGLRLEPMMEHAVLQGGVRGA